MRCERSRKNRSAPVCGKAGTGRIHPGAAGRAVRAQPPVPGQCGAGRFHLQPGDADAGVPGALLQQRRAAVRPPGRVPGRPVRPHRPPGPRVPGRAGKNTAGLFRGGGPGGSGKVAPFLRPSIRDKEKRCPRERRPGTALFGLRRRRAVTSDRTASGICPPDSRCRRWGQRGRRPAPPPRRAPAGSRSGGSCPGASR